MLCQASQKNVFQLLREFSGDFPFVTVHRAALHVRQCYVSTLRLVEESEGVDSSVEAHIVMPASEA